MQRLSRRAKRRSPRANRVILGRQELSAYFQVGEANLEEFLRSQNIPFHEDANGELWASILLTESPP